MNKLEIFKDCISGDLENARWLEDRMVNLPSSIKLYYGKRSEVRNRLLADLLTRTIYMEKAGTGIKRVHDACKKNGNKVVFEFSDAFWIRIYSNEKGNNVVDSVVDHVVDNRLTEILNLIKDNHKISAAQIAKKCNVSSRTAQRYLKQLKDSNRIIRIGDERTGYWKIL